MATTFCPFSKDGFGPAAVKRNRPHDAMVGDRSKGPRHHSPESATRTRAATLMEGVSCTSTADALPMTRWFVMTSPGRHRRESGRARRRSPDGDEAVLPLGQEQRRIVFLGRRRG